MTNAMVLVIVLLAGLAVSVPLVRIIEWPRRDW